MPNLEMLVLAEGRLPVRPQDKPVVSGADNFLRLCKIRSPIAAYLAQEDLARDVAKAKSIRVWKISSFKLGCQYVLQSVNGGGQGLRPSICSETAAFPYTPGTW